MKKKFIKPRCEACGSFNILTNKKGDRRCRVCGNEWESKPNKVGV